MKVLVHFAPGPKHDIYEGARLRKNIKGALELNNIAWVDSLYALPDVCHIISPTDEALAKAAKEEGIPLVVSALYSEQDPYASFMTRSLSGELSLTSKGKKIIELADMVLTPSEYTKSLIVNEILGKHIEVLTPGVNPIRFDTIDPLSEKIFARYERFSADTKYFLVAGNYADKKTLESLRSLAIVLPSYRFFNIGGDYGQRAKALSKLNKHNPKNLTFLPVVPDDIYRSAMKGALGHIVFESSTMESLVCLEAMAAKTQIFYIGGKDLHETFLAASKSFIQYASIEEAAKRIPTFTPSSPEATIMEGYKVAQENNLTMLGNALKTLYRSLIQKEGNHD